MDFDRWNEVIAKHFFNENNAAREVVLYVDDNLINQLGRSYNADVNNFIESVIDGPVWAKGKSFADKALYTLERSQRFHREDHPKYIAYLAFLVLAVDTEGGFSEISYYPRLNKRLDEVEKKGAPHGFIKFDQLWNDLQTWSIDINNEKYGRFIVKISGPWCHAGIPISQTLLTSEERRKLPIFFSNNNFDPTSPPAYDVISSAMLVAGVFKNRTIRLLSSTDKQDSFHKVALLQTVEESLREWDGSVFEEHHLDNKYSDFTQAMLKICFRINPLLKNIDTTVRFKTNRQFPEDEIEISKHGCSEIWSCEEHGLSWSTELVEKDSFKKLNASMLDWEHGETFFDINGSWKIKLNRDYVRLFKLGKREGLPGWVETNMLENDMEHYISCNVLFERMITEWGNKNCKGFSKVDIIGLPQNWFLYKIEKAYASHPSINVLKLPISASLRFEGGIRSGHGNSYFSFAPPTVVVEGIDSEVVVKAGGEELHRLEDGTWKIPQNIQLGVPHKVELFIGDKPLITRSIILESTCILREYNPPLRNSFGLITVNEHENVAVTGAEVIIKNKLNICDYPPELPSYLSHRIIYIGSYVNEYCEWPDEGEPKTWNPIWAIAKTGKDKWKAYFVANRSGLLPPLSKGKLHGWKKWKKTFCNLRVESPKIQKLSKLWHEYKREADSL